MAYAPEALKELADSWESSVGSAILSGIVGDSAHNRGYHRSANELPSSDYSRQLEADRVGIDGNAASAIDISMNAADMKRVTQSFYNSWKDPNDLRLNYVREVIGTLDGSNVIYMDCQNGERSTADRSHLWHIHIGFLRRYATNFDATQAVLSIVEGKSYEEFLGGDDMASASEIADEVVGRLAFNDIAWGVSVEPDDGVNTQSNQNRWASAAHSAAEANRKIDELSASVAELADSVKSLEAGRVDVAALVEALLPLLTPALSEGVSVELVDRLKAK